MPLPPSDNTFNKSLWERKRKKNENKVKTLPPPALCTEPLPAAEADYLRHAKEIGPHAARTFPSSCPRGFPTIPRSLSGLASENSDGRTENRHPWKLWKRFGKDTSEQSEKSFICFRIYGKNSEGIIHHSKLEICPGFFILFNNIYIFFFFFYKV